MASDYSEGCGYVAIPIETLDRLDELLEEAIGALYTGNTQKGMKVLEKINQELGGYNGSTEKVNESERQQTDNSTERKREV